MYSNIRSVQIVVTLLKQYGIKDIILSPGGSDIPLIHSIELDEYFTCYSVVDERSAAYFAMGVSQQRNNRPVACICTSGTAVCNYVPGITEAHYQNVPVLAITADKNPYYQDQLETQKICQNHVFEGVIKKSVELPVIHNEEDEWLCNRLVNEALLSLTHHGTGPVQINIPIVGPTNIYDCPQLPIERKMQFLHEPFIDWREYANYLKNKKIMVVVGQNCIFSDEDVANFDLFFEKYDCIFSTENLSNVKCRGAINTYPITEMRPQASLKHLMPDVVISIGNNLAAYNLKPFLRKNYKRIENWMVSENGEVRDAYKCLTNIFECPVSSFFRNIIANSNLETASKDYYTLWKKEKEKILLPDFEFSNFYVAQKLSQVIPEKSILHTAILNSTRIMQFFELADGVRVYSNVGALGIDGCFSTFAGQAAVCKELAFLVIGDLSFFYDMNAAGLSSLGKNVRVILLNNGGGSEFQFFMGKKNIPTLDTYICAEHEKVAAGWIWSLGYEYYSAASKEEFDAVIEKFGKPSDKPLFLEVFTDMEEDADRTNSMYDVYRVANESSMNKIKKKLQGVLPKRKMEKVKKILSILKEK